MNCEHYIEPRGTNEEEERKEKNMADSMFKIMRNLGVLSKNKNGWVKALTLTSWNDNPAKLDIREWNEDYTRCGKGVTFTEDEASALKAILDQEDI